MDSAVLQGLRYFLDIFDSFFIFIDDPLEQSDRLKKWTKNFGK